MEVMQKFWEEKKKAPYLSGEKKKKVSVLQKWQNIVAVFC